MPSAICGCRGGSPWNYTRRSRFDSSPLPERKKSEAPSRSTTVISLDLFSQVLGSAGCESVHCTPVTAKHHDQENLPHPEATNLPRHSCCSQWLPSPTMVVLWKRSVLLSDCSLFKFGDASVSRFILQIHFFTFAHLSDDPRLIAGWFATTFTKFPFFGDKQKQENRMDTSWTIWKEGTSLSVCGNQKSECAQAARL